MPGLGLGLRLGTPLGSAVTPPAGQQFIQSRNSSGAIETITARNASGTIENVTLRVS